MPETPAERYKKWFLESADRLRATDTPPATAADVERRAVEIRARMQRASGDWPAERAPLDPQIHGTLERDGYRIEKLSFQTRARCYATATAYVPTRGGGPFPAVLCVHGHWSGARRDPVVQSRCIGLAKLGFVALTLDAWGSGERGTEIGKNEYHGGLLGASLWPVNTPLHALQLYDNVRAVDYLQARPEVRGDRIGCTGASGGGNQTTYFSAFDPRIRCAVPVCSVGTFRSYLDTACCVDEVLIGALTIGEEGDLLGSLAPRALMVITASRDAYHFGPVASGAAVDRARPYFKAAGAEERVRHVVFDSGHAYNREMREAMYGWMTRWLKETGDGAPISEPAFETDDMEALRCFAPPFRSPRVMTTVQWVKERAVALSAAQPTPVSRGEWERQRSRNLDRLNELLRLPAAPAGTPRGARASAIGPTEGVIETEPGFLLPVVAHRGGSLAPAQPAVVLLHPMGRKVALDTPLAVALREAGIATFAPELRGCGELTLDRQGLSAEIPDHNLAEWSLLLDRPLLGQWVHDAIATVRALGAWDCDPDHAAIVGWREAGLAAALAAALEPRTLGAAALEVPATYITETPPHGVRMALFSPGLLEVGDTLQAAALVAPRPLLVANPIRLNGSAVSAGDLDEVTAAPRSLYERLGEARRFVAGVGLTDSRIVSELRDWFSRRKKRVGVQVELPELKRLRRP